MNKTIKTKILQNPQDCFFYVRFLNAYNVLSELINLQSLKFRPEVNYDSPILIKEYQCVGKFVDRGADILHIFPETKKIVVLTDEEENVTYTGEEEISFNSFLKPFGNYKNDATVYFPLYYHGFYNYLKETSIHDFYNHLCNQIVTKLFLYEICNVMSPLFKPDEIEWPSHHYKPELILELLFPTLLQYPLGREYAIGIWKKELKFFEESK